MKLIIQRASIILPIPRNKKRFRWTRFLPLNGMKMQIVRNEIEEKARPTISSRFIMLDFALLYCEKWKTRQWGVVPFIHAKYIFVEDNYAERICGRGSSLRFVPFLITVFHLKSLPSYHETSCISLFMYEKWFKAARESSREKIRVAISKASFPGSGSLHP